MPDVFGITGWKNSGKTTLVSALVAEFSRRGFAVSTVKHAHSGFAIDHEGTDSHKHREAGAREVAIVSDARWAIVHEVRSTGAKPSLRTMLEKMAPCDLVLVEGFKDTNFPKIECIRAASRTDDPIWKRNGSVVALASDHKVEDAQMPQFDIDAVSDIADYIAQMTGLGL